MRRKLINFETLERIRQGSLSAAERELREAEDVLAAALEVDGLSLNFLTQSQAIFENLDGTYVRADYGIKQNYLTFENIEQLVVDEESATKHSLDAVRGMVEAILKDDAEKADSYFDAYMALPNIKRTLSEGREGGFIRDAGEARAAGKSKSRNAKANPGLSKSRKRKLDSVSLDTGKRSKRDSLNLGSADDPNYQKRYHKMRKAKNAARKVIDAKGNVKIKKAMKEWATISEGVLGYVSYLEHGPTFEKSFIQKDDGGNVTALRIPTKDLRTEGKLLKFNWKTLNTDCKVLRDGAKTVSHNENFTKFVLAAKRFNGVSDNSGFQESIDSIIDQFPSVLFLTQGELATQIGESLKSANVNNFDDEVCDFLAEAILKNAHDVYTDKVARILNLSGVGKIEGKDQYAEFKKVVDQFYPNVDENFATEAKVFADLFEAVSQVADLASHIKDEELGRDSNFYLDELKEVLEGRAAASAEFAEEIAEWLVSIVETNLTQSDWVPVEKPHITVNGDHPAMAEKARKGYSPAQDSSGDWTDPAPQIDDDLNYKGGAAERARSNSWGNVGGNDTYPSLNNPYIPKAADFTMKGEKGADKEDGLGYEGGSDTWPNLQNPNIPADHKSQYDQITSPK